MSDYLEAPLYLDECDEDDTPTLYVHLRDRSMLAFHGVTLNPVRYHGFWSISHVFPGLDRQATSVLPADEVVYFSVVGSAEGGVVDDTPVAGTTTEGDIHA